MTRLRAFGAPVRDDAVGCGGDALHDDATHMIIVRGGGYALHKPGSAAHVFSVPRRWRPGFRRSWRWTLCGPCRRYAGVVPMQPHACSLTACSLTASSLTASSFTATSFTATSLCVCV